jgi:hypothetical protein
MTLDEHSDPFRPRSDYRKEDPMPTIVHPFEPDSDAAVQVRQGDVLLVPVDRIPAGVKLVPRDAGRVVLAYGEVTGHAHAIRSNAATLLADGEERFLRVTAPVVLDHEEHAAIDVRPGTYRVVIQCEYVATVDSTEWWRRVED